MPRTKPPTKPAKPPATHISALKLENFTVFKKAEFEFVPGINVILGTNGTGKTHALKLAKSAGGFLRGPDRVSALHLAYFEDYFRLGSREHHKLIRLSAPKTKARFVLRVGAHELDFFIPPSGAEEPPDMDAAEEALRNRYLMLKPPVFIPSREVFSLYEGFIFSYEKRELSFDRTYYDVCVAMSGPRLKGEGLAVARELAKPLMDELGGEPILQGNRFVLRRPDGDVDAHLLAEGHRKIAELAHLVLNGSIAADSVVLWDEPESNLNPKLIKVVANFIVQLAHKGAQVILATHDYLLMRRLSLIGEHKTVPGLTVRFHALTPGTAEQGVQLQSADTMPEITDNPVVDEYVKHYDFEKTVEAAERKGGPQDWEALLASH